MDDKRATVYALLSLASLAAAIALALAAPRLMAGAFILSLLAYAALAAYHRRMSSPAKFYKNAKKRR